VKVSQKIDSFMSSLGINVGHTGGSLMAEATIFPVLTLDKFTLVNAEATAGCQAANRDKRR
jgi:hypothetical protein